MKPTIISPKKLKGYEYYQTILIDFHRKTISDLVIELSLKLLPIKYKEFRNEELAGYSVGGALALMLAQNINIKKLTLISPSPFFKERLKTLPKYILKGLGKKRLADIQNYSVKDFDKITAETTIIVGSKEPKDMISFAKYLNKKIKNSALVIKEGFRHTDFINK